ncbi:C-C chemokine receptor type [Trichinella spiralis]|uniref:NADH dehydrogenase [ubiquinone] 1 beta subcomplex subunit 11, mitochondrial n=1 Tax=Trichinella spiralis TaxID=6334 RepID=A0ABR3K524_TRISP
MLAKLNGSGSRALWRACGYEFRNLSMANVLYKSQDDIPDEIKQSPYYRKSRFDWLFGEGYRRPLAADQGGKMYAVCLLKARRLRIIAGKCTISACRLSRRGWLAYGFHPTDEYTDWKRAHAVFFALIGIAFPGLVFVLWYKPDWPLMREWAFREAVLELERRERAGLEPISKDLINPEKKRNLSIFNVKYITFYCVVKVHRIIIKCGFCQS